MSDRYVTCEPNFRSGAQPTVGGPEPVEATDAARALADEAGVGLDEIDGTGAGGRVTKPDVDDALSQEE